LVPVFNGERYLADALDSILAQTYPLLEIIVVDDGSTDGTPAVVARYADKVSYMRQANAGQAAARNRGLAAAKGEFVAFLDADDLWHPQKLARQMARFEARPELGFCTTYIKNFWIPELQHEEQRLRDHPFAAERPSVAPTLMARLCVFDRVGRFDASLKHRDTTDWVSRAGDQGVVSEVLPEVLVYRRIHRNNTSRRREAADHDDLFRIVKAALDRRRTS
jgi:glycosyltransferase involved in cell wall biosynthesis